MVSRVQELQRELEELMTLKYNYFHHRKELTPEEEGSILEEISRKNEYIQFFMTGPYHKSSKSTSFDSKFIRKMKKYTEMNVL